jgi:tetratricopeptide (TPR) repeat protein
MHDHGEAARLIRDALSQYRTSEEAETLVKDILKTDKATFDALQMLGIKEGQRGNDAGAERLFRHALTINGASSETCHNLGIVLQKQGKLQEAAASYRQAIALQPGFAMAYFNLGNTLTGQGKHSEATESFQQAVIIRPDYAEAHSNLGNALRELGRLSEAIESCRRAIELRPDFAKAHNNLGNAFLEQGMLTDAAESYEKALELNPDFAEAYRNYSTCRKFTVENHALADRLEELLGKVQTDTERCSLHFALGKIYDDVKMYDASFLHYLSGNQLERNTFIYAWRDFSSHVDRLISTFSPDYFRCRSWAGSFSELPVFILGMPRSGTTLIEQIISSHPLVCGAGELKCLEGFVQGFKAQREISYPECATYLTHEDFAKISGHYLDHLQSFSQDSLRITDKMPGNFLHLGFISLLFPQAKVIHCTRNPLDTCLSIFFQKFTSRLPYSCDLIDLGHYYRDYMRLMEHWRSVLPPAMMIDVQYEEVVEKPEEMSRKLIEFCGLKWDERCLRSHENERAVRTASSWQVRQPIYTTSKERWKRYEKHLGPLQRAIAGEDN